MMRLRLTFRILDFRLPIDGSATRLLVKGQRRLRSKIRQSTIHNRQFVTDQSGLSAGDALGSAKVGLR